MGRRRSEGARALRLKPGLQIAKNNLEFFQQHGHSAATAQPWAQSAATLINPSLALHQAGKYEESIAAAQVALRIDPHSAEAWNNIAAQTQRYTAGMPLRTLRARPSR